jgi:hypothetical protein
LAFFSQGTKSSDPYAMDSIYSWVKLSDPYRGGKEIYDFINRISPTGWTDPRDSMTALFTMPGPDGLIKEPDVIFFLSDGGFNEDGKAIDVIKHYNNLNIKARVTMGKKPIVTHTFSIVDKGGRTDLQQIIGHTNVALGFPRWKGPCTYRHIDFASILTLGTQIESLREALGYPP